MPQITFYRQCRVDGAIRTGIEIDGETFFGKFDTGSRDEDPVLAWWVDVRCQGKNLPEDGEPARQWLLDNETFISKGLLGLADHLRTGLDMDGWPFQWQVELAPAGTEIVIVCSTIHRATGVTFATILKSLARQWKSIVKRLRSVQEVAG